ncbi:MAG: DJ-1/PfpI family protein, partial [Oscillospiraceae bacterium]|nr:DJ-1/PfpI family protein [Oscillospiraceae bacterium]
MIYVFLAEGFEEIEAITPIDMLRRCELDVVTVGIGSKNITGSHGITVSTDIEESNIILDDNIEMIILPGGMPGTLNLEASDYVQKAIDYCADKNKYIAAICAAPSILGHKNLLHGKNATCYKGLEDHLIGANIVFDDVAVDGNIITSRGAGTALPFSFALIKLLISEEKSEMLHESI